MQEFAVRPSPDDPRLTRTVSGVDQEGRRVETAVVVERPLTLFLNRREIVTMMTIGDHPDYLAVGYLLNQNMLQPDDRVIAIDLKAVWLCMKYEIPQMLKQGGGAIVNTASIAGLLGFNDAPAYVAAKHGVVGLTRTAALEFAQKNIRVNCVCPGVIRTPMVERALDSGGLTEAAVIAAEPVGRLGKPEEIAEGVLWLLSDASSFVTGHPLTIDGGWVAR